MTVNPPADFSKTYDLIDFFSDLDAFLKANMGTWITQMNTDRSEVTLPSISSEAYYFQTLNESWVNHEQFVFYGESGSTSDSINAETAQSYNVDVAVFINVGADNNEDVAQKLLRFRMILRELFEKGWNKVNKKVRLEISNLAPFPLAETNTTNLVVGIGVSLEVNFG